MWKWSLVNTPLSELQKTLYLVKTINLFFIFLLLFLGGSLVSLNCLHVQPQRGTGAHYFYFSCLCSCFASFLSRFISYNSCHVDILVLIALLGPTILERRTICKLTMFWKFIIEWYLIVGKSQLLLKNFTVSDFSILNTSVRIMFRVFLRQILLLLLLHHPPNPNYKLGPKNG